MKWGFKFLISIFLFFLVFFLSENQKLRKLELIIYDFNIRKATLKENLPLVIIGIKEDFEKEIGETFSRKHYAEILRILKNENPKLVISDIFFPSFSENKLEDIELLESIKENGRVILPVFSPVRLSKREKFYYVVDKIRGSDPRFEKFALSVGHINVFQDVDQIVRKFPICIKYDNKYFFQLGIEAKRKIEDDFHIDTHEIPVDKDGCFLIRFIEPKNLNKYFISFSDVLKGKFERNFFKDKIVIIGQTIVGAKNADLIPTPFGTYFGVFVQASAIGTTLSGKYIRYVHKNIYTLLYSVFLSLIFSSKILLNTFYTFVIFSGVLVSNFLFIKSGIYFNSVPFLFLTLLYYLFSLFYSLYFTLKKLFQKETMLSFVKEVEEEFTKISNLGESLIKDEVSLVGFMNEELIEKTPFFVLKTILVVAGIESGCLVSLSNDKVEIIVDEGEKIEIKEIEKFVKNVDSSKIINERINGEVKEIAIIPIILLPNFKIYGIFMGKKPTSFSKSRKFTFEDIKFIETLALQGLFAIQNSQLNLILKNAQLETIFRLAIAIEYRDRETGGHIHRVSEYSYLIAEGLGLKKEECILIKNAMPLHDIGKIAIPDHILLKPDKLTDEERKIIEKHPIIGSQMLKGSKSIILQAAEIIALYHHEKFDGTGYPYKVSGRQIPIYGRIATLSDVFDAITSKRIYKEPLKIQEAFEIIDKEKGKTFDPKIVEVFLERKDEVIRIKEKYEKQDYIYENYF